MRSESTVAFGHPSETKPTFGCAGMTMEAALAAVINRMIKKTARSVQLGAVHISRLFSGRSFLVLFEGVRLGRSVIRFVFRGTGRICSKREVTEDGACLLL